MQNLKTVHHRCFNLSESHAPLTAIAWNLVDDSIISSHGPTRDNPLLTLVKRRDTSEPLSDGEKLAAWDADHPATESGQHEKIANLHCFSDDGSIVLIFTGGDIVVVNEDNGQHNVEIVGSIDAGIDAAEWSPDESLLFIKTAANTVLIMTRSFDSSADITLSDGDLEVSNHVSVGWGKAETQFKGRGAKALRDPTVPERFDTGKLSTNDDAQTSISWRGDGQYVAMSSIISNPERRVIRVYTRQGELDSVSEPVDGLEGVISWKPSGQTIAATQRTSDSLQVIFFERNGLRHGEFDLRLAAEEMASRKVLDLKWNTDSSVLLVALEDRIQLWTSSNYHWYLKQQIHLESSSSAASSAWHPEKPLHLACSDGSRSLQTMQYNSQYSLGPVTPPQDLGVVATIDGSKLNITPIKIANIPPPMSYDEISLTSQVIDVTINSSSTSIAVLTSNQVHFYNTPYQSKPPQRASLSSTIELSDSLPEFSRAVRIAFVEESAIRVEAVSSQGEHCISILYDLEGRELSNVEHAQMKTAVSLISTTEDYKQTVNGAKEDVTISETTYGLPQTCVNIQLWRNISQTIAFGRTESGTLHIKSDAEHLKIAGCTSFVISQTHLIYTTSQHMLKFVHLHDGKLNIPLDTPEKDERCRMVERGAKIVTVMPSSYSVVLQMTRGNLETIYPRVLVLSGIRQSLLNRNYKKAFATCRSQRVDMNILYDYAPERFLQDVELFTQQVSKAEHIDLFLSSLTEEDTAKTIYRDTLIHNALEDQPEVPDLSMPRSKINVICDAFLAVLTRQPKHLQSTITAHVCKNPPDLESGLKLIADLHSKNNEDDVKQAIEHITFLSDVNLLYDTALGMYELELTLLVAQKSQKDPREYLPYLQSLRDLADARRRFTIDNDLRRYEKALLHLYALGEFEELIKFIERHELYAQAIELYRHDKSRLDRLMRAYADFLVSTNKYSDAALAYEYVHDYDKSLKAYQSASMWQEALSMAMFIPLPEDELQQLAHALADSLEEAKAFGNAATIHLDYLNDLATSIKLKCKAYDFSEAIRLAVMHKQPLLLQEVVDPGLIECSASMTELLAEMKNQINAQVPRLRELRLKKIEKPMAYLDAAEGEGGDVPDNLSVAPTDASTSGGTFMTRYTNRSSGTLATNATRKTSRNRRREERKRAQGKKGTIYEEEYLVNSISRLLQRLDTVSVDVTSLVKSLMRRTMRERAVAVENAMIELEALCRTHMVEVFHTTQAIDAVQQRDTSEDIPRPVGGDGVLADSMAASEKVVEPPPLRCFERLSLISGRT